MAEYECKINSGVICTLHSGCDRCGWNPFVSKRRTTDLTYKPVAKKTIKTYKLSDGREVKIAYVER